VLLLLVAAVAGAVWYLAREDKPPPATVPRVVGLDERAAVRRLGGEGLTASVERRRRDGTPRGVVYAQRPRGGGELGSGAIVTVLVASGPATTVVPSVTGMPAGRAARVLGAAHLRANRVPVFSEQPVGTVVSQFPRANGRTDRDAAVRINVAQGASRVRVPDVLGRTVTGAVSVLGRAGVGSPQVVRVPSAAPEGKVVAQSPVAGSQIARGDSVRIDVSDGTGAPTTTEPENPHTPVLLGFGEREAVEELENAGYIVRVRRRHTDDPREDGTVIEQQPPGGGPRGSVITLVVGDAGA
jgi:beta-lactam-binding protein with PASTA domain